MAVSGLGMALWLTLHMLGNLLVFAGPAVMNGYAEKLRETGLLWPMRVLLVGALVVHVVSALVTTRRAHAARTTGYRVRLHGRARSWAGRSMRVGGVLLLGFLAYHVAQIYGVGHPDFVPGDVHHNLLAVVKVPWHALAYLVATALLALHLAHGLASAWISLGVIAQRRERLVKRALRGWAWAVTIGFAVTTLWPVVA